MPILQVYYCFLIAFPKKQEYHYLVKNFRRSYFMNSVMAALKLVMAFFTLLPQVLAPLGGMINEAAYFENWSPEQEYTAEYAVTLEKEPGKDFVVLNFADVQLKDIEYYEGYGALAEEMMTKLINEQKPDLITLTGDNAWGTVAYINLVNFIDSFGIPWAPVMGNHDGQNCINEFWCAYLFNEAENCVWKFGPEGMGYGNYIINIEENGSVVHTIFMMDTHDDGTWTVDGSEVSGYDHLWADQIEWYEWAVKGIAEAEGRTVESSLFIHIPVFEVKEVWEQYYDQETDTWTGAYADKAEGIIHETPCPGAVNNHFTDKMIELGSTKNVIFGHDHVCNASINYEGIQLTYGLKLGSGCYYEEGLMGGTTLTIGSDGCAQYEHHFCD